MLFLYLFYSPLQPIPQDSTRFERSDLNDHLTVFNGRTGSYVPAREGINSNTYRLTLEPPIPAPAYLVFRSTTDRMIVYQGEVTHFFKDSLRIPLDSLISMSPTSALTFSITSLELGPPSDLRVYLETPLQQSEEPIVADRPTSETLDFALVTALLILFYLAMLVNRFPKDSADYSRWLRSFNFQNREETLMNTRPFSRNNILFMILTSALIGYCLQMLLILAPGVLKFPTFWLYQQSLLLAWLELSVLTFFVISIRYVLISLFNRLFNLGDFRVIQFLNSIRYSLGTFFFAFLAIVVIYLTARQGELFAYEIIAFTVAFLLLLRVGVMFFKLMNFSRHAVFHLFSYLCATEIIPFLMLYKLILG